MSECFDFIVRHELAHLVLGHLRDDARSIRADPVAVHDSARKGVFDRVGDEFVHDEPERNGDARIQARRIRTHVQTDAGRIVDRSPQLVAQDSR